MKSPFVSYMIEIMLIYSYIENNVGQVATHVTYQNTIYHYAKPVRIYYRQNLMGFQPLIRVKFK